LTRRRSSKRCARCLRSGNRPAIAVPARRDGGDSEIRVRVHSHPAPHRATPAGECKIARGHPEVQGARGPRIVPIDLMLKRHDPAGAGCVPVAPICKAFGADGLVLAPSELALIAEAFRDRQTKSTARNSSAGCKALSSDARTTRQHSTETELRNSPGACSRA
jgi:hypothetical protein